MAVPLPVAKVKGYLTAVKSDLELLLSTPPLNQQHDRGNFPENPMTGAISANKEVPDAPELQFDQLLQLQVWVLNLELLQRGNSKALATKDLVSPSGSAASELNVTLALVRETSGKEVIMLTSSDCPSSSSSPSADPVRNLLSNASILQGRVVEAIATSSPSLSCAGPPQPKSSVDVVDVALLSQVQARCRVVQDDRFLSLITLLSSLLAPNAAAAPAPPGAPPRSSSGGAAAPNQDDDSHRLAWSYVAEGCYGRAAVLARTSPPPFKAAWDVVAQRNRRHDDHSEHRQNPYAWEALDWIAQLRRIASGRNNHKKVTELSLSVLELCLPIPSLEHFLSVDSELSKSSAPLFKARAPPTTTASPSSPTLLSTVQRAYVMAVRSIDPPAPEAVLDMCEEQLQFLKAHQSKNDEDGAAEASSRLEVQTCTYQLLWTIQRHDHAIREDGQARHVAAMNRRSSAADKAPSKSATGPSSSSSNSATVPTLDECLRQARTDFFQRMANDDEYVQTYIDRGGVDALVEAMQGAASVPEATPEVSADEATSHGADRSSEGAGGMAPSVVVVFLASWHRDYLQAKMLQHHRKRQQEQRLSLTLVEWTQRTISNLLRGWRGANEESLESSKTPPTWVVTLATMVPELEWMLHNALSASDAHIFPLDVHRVAQTVLQSALDNVPPPSSGAGSLVARDLNSPSRLPMLQWANRSIVASMYLSQQSDKEVALSNLPALLSEQVTGATPSNWSGRFGTAFLEFAVVWSGLHTTVPWPYCVTPEARIAVDRARTSFQWAEKHWGRPASDAEDWLLKVALADAEGGARVAGSSFSGTGGLVGVAKTLYEQVLDEVNIATDAGKVGLALRALLKSKCYSGLVNVALHSSLGEDHVLDFMSEDELKTPEGLSRRNLDLILQALNDPESMNWAPLRMFGSSFQAMERTFRLQVAYVRNQVSDCLMRKCRIEEAGVFLQDAVLACPDDPVATLALGSFRLRLMFLDSVDPTPSTAKAAQIQLLKAAKLDSSRSSPFALLGYWYEFMKDEKRALGCYSKALLLDPWHPVAGRGILRLQPRGSVLHLLQKAADSGSPFSGWAWMALGLQKAMIEGSDDLAVVCLLQALRCADVASPTGSDLSVFFSSPFHDKEAGGYELVDAFAELAECYRRLGRLTASLRTYNKALDSAACQGSPRPSLLLSCAQGKYSRVSLSERRTQCIRLMRPRLFNSRNGAWTV
jgi:tetratricopeptide (TPR) repeat protein